MRTGISAPVDDVPQGSLALPSPGGPHRRLLDLLRRAKALFGEELGNREGAGLLDRGQPHELASGLVDVEHLLVEARDRDEVRRQRDQRRELLELLERALAVGDVMEGNQHARGMPSSPDTSGS